jgi:hypothetical protein
MHTPLSSNSIPTKVSEVYEVQYSSPPQSEGKNKIKNKPKKNNNQTENKKHKHIHLLLKRNHSAN